MTGAHRLGWGMSQSDRRKSQAHLCADEMVSYIDQVMTEGLRRQVESHLAECEACLREVIEVTRLLRRQI